MPQGYGASSHIYDLGVYNLNLGYRVLYPPHSGFMVLLYEYSALGLVVVMYLAWQVLRPALVASVTEWPRATEARASRGVSSVSLRTCDRKLASHLLLMLAGLWLSHNLFYLKGVITAAGFSDDGILIYGTIAMVLYRLLIAPPANEISEVSTVVST